MNRSAKYAVGFVIVLLTLSLPHILQAQGTLTLEGLAERVESLFVGQSDLEQRLVTIEKQLSIETYTPTPTATSTATPTFTPTPEPSASLQVNRNMNVRRGPGTHHAIIGQAVSGSTFDVMGANSDKSWWQIDYAGEIGWVYAGYVTTEAIDNVPVAATPTPLAAAPTNTPTRESQTLEPTDYAAILIIRDFVGRDEMWIWDGMNENQKTTVIGAYTLLLTFGAAYCDLSMEDMTILLDEHGEVLDEADFFPDDLTRSRGYLLGFLYGAGENDPDNRLWSCDDMLRIAVAASLSD